ncbi:MAG: hypothetical protein ABI155_16585 [Paralcaligenes sp.]
MTKLLTPQQLDSYHQSGYISPVRVLSEQQALAIKDHLESNGAMQIMAQTHLLDQVPHKDPYSKDNMLTRGQEVAVEVDRSKAVSLNKGTDVSSDNDKKALQDEA